MTRYQKLISVFSISGLVTPEISSVASHNCSPHWNPASSHITMTMTPSVRHWENHNQVSSLTLIVSRFESFAVRVSMLNHCCQMKTSRKLPSLAWKVWGKHSMLQRVYVEDPDPELNSQMRNLMKLWMWMMKMEVMEKWIGWSIVTNLAPVGHGWVCCKRPCLYHKDPWTRRRNRLSNYSISNNR